MSKKTTHAGSKDSVKLKQSQAQKPDNGQSKGLMATAEQMRIAQILNKDEESEIHSKVIQVRELTGCNEGCAAMALHDCEFDLERAVDHVLEHATGEGGGQEDEWHMTTKRHSKKPTASAVGGDVVDDWAVNDVPDEWASGLASENGQAAAYSEVAVPSSGAAVVISTDSQHRRGKDRRRGGGGGGGGGSADNSRPRRGDRRNRGGAAAGQNSNGQHVADQTSEEPGTDWPKSEDTSRQRGEWPSGSGESPAGDWSEEMSATNTIPVGSGAVHYESSSARGGGRGRGGRGGRMGRYGRGGAVQGDSSEPPSWGGGSGDRGPRRERSSRGGGSRTILPSSSRGGRRGGGSSRGGSGGWHDRHENGGNMEISTWAAEASAGDRADRLPEVEGWDDAGDLEGEWKGDCLIVTNSSVSQQDDFSLSSSLRQSEPITVTNSAFKISNEATNKSHNSNETQRAKDAYNRLATESIKNAIGLKPQELTTCSSTSTSQHHKESIVDSFSTNDDKRISANNAIFGQRQARSKPPPSSTQIPEAPVQLAPTIQASQTKVSLQFDFGTGSILQNTVTSSKPSPPPPCQQTVVCPSSQIDVPINTTPPLPISEPVSSSPVYAPIVDNRTSLTGSPLHSSMNQSPSAHQTPQKPVLSTSQQAMYESPYQQQSVGTSVPDNKITGSPGSAFGSQFQTSQAASTRGSVPIPNKIQSSSPYSSPGKPVMPSGSGFQNSLYQNNYGVDISDNMSKLGLSDQSKDPSSFSTSHGKSMSSQPSMGMTQQQQQQIHQLKNAGSTINTGSSSTNVSQQQHQQQQHMPPGMSPLGLPFPCFVDYEQLIQQQRILMMDLQNQQQMSGGSVGGSLTTAGDGQSSGGIKSGPGGGAAPGMLNMRSDLQSPPTTSSGQSGGHQMAQQAGAGLSMPYNIPPYYYMAAAAAAQAQAGGNQFYPFMPNAMNSFLQHQASQNPSQGHPGAALNPQQYQAPAKPMNAYTSFPGGQYDDLDMSKFSSQQQLGKAGYGGGKPAASSTYHSAGLQQSDKTGSSLSASGAVGVHGNQPGSAGVGGAGSGVAGGVGGGGGFPSYTSPSFPPSMYGSPYMAMPGQGSAAGMVHHSVQQNPSQQSTSVAHMSSQDSGSSRMVNTGSGVGPKSSGMGKFGNPTYWNN